MTKSPYQPKRIPVPKPKRVLRSADSSPYDASGRKKIPPVYRQNVQNSQDPQ